MGHEGGRSAQLCALRGGTTGTEKIAPYVKDIGIVYSIAIGYSRPQKKDLPRLEGDLTSGSERGCLPAFLLYDCLNKITETDALNK